MSYAVTRDADGATVHPGDTIADFRGDTWTFVRATRASSREKSGKVLVSASGGHSRDDRELYSTVFNLTVTTDPR